MRGVSQMDVHGPAAASIAQVVQDPMGHSATTGLSAAERTPPTPVNTAAPLDPGRRQVLRPHDPFRRIRDIVTGAVHDRSSRRSASGVDVGQFAPATPRIRNNGATVSQTGGHFYPPLTAKRPLNRRRSRRASVASLDGIA